VNTHLVLQFSTVAPDWYRWTPSFLRRIPFHILFDKNWASPWIRRVNHSPFSHVDFVLDDDSLLGASDSPSAPVIKGNPRGVAIRPPDYEDFAYRRRMVIETDRLDDIINIALTQLGKDFDNSGIKDFMSDKFPGMRDWRLNNSWFCAELAMWAMETGGLWQPYRVIWPRNRVSPTDIVLTLLMDPRFVNRATFWEPVPGLELGPHER
jgi:hypothetical protein